jgi:hypothetical protein
MFEQDEHGQVPVTTALRSIRSKLVDQIKWRPNDQSAIVLFGTVCTSKLEGKNQLIA